MATRSSATITRPQGWQSAARQAWRDVRTALTETARFQHPSDRRALERAQRLRPAWFSLETQPGEQVQRVETTERAPVALAPFDMSPDADDDMAGPDVLDLGDAPSTDPAPAPSSSQLDTLWNRARQLVRELNAATDRARERRRVESMQSARDIAEATEQGLTAIVRPLARAVSMTLEPATRAASGAAMGLGLLVALAVAAYAFTHNR